MARITLLNLIFFSFLSYSQPSLVWKYETALPIYSSPVVSGDAVYFGSSDSTLYALNVNNGSVIWKFRTKGEIRSNVCINENSLFLNGGDGTFYALDKNSGSLLWTFNSEGEKLYPFYSYADYFHSSPIYSNNIVYFGSGDGNLYALEAADGNLLWKFKTNDVIHSTPIIYNDKLYTGSFDGHVYCLDAEQGKMIWKFKTVGQRFFPNGEVQGNLAADCGLIFAGARDYNVYAIDAEKGYCHWNRQFPKGWALALTAVDSILYSGTSDDDMLIAFNSITGEELWNIDVNFNIFGAPLPLNEFIYFGTLKGKFYKLRITGDKILWEFDTEGYRANKEKYFKSKEIIEKNDFYAIVGTPEGYIKALNELGSIFTKPAVYKDMIMFTSTDGNIYCIKQE